MVRSALLLTVFASFFLFGASTPFILTLGYVWVDTFRPQSVAYLILNQLPVAMLMGGAAVGAYLLLDRRAPPRLSLIAVLQILLALWVTATCLWAEVPQAAWEKWDWAFKTILFSAFIPFAIRSRVQIEAFLQVYLFSLAANIIPFGVKVALSGGGYGRNLGLGEGNSGLAEGSTLAAVSVMAIPLLMYLSKNSLILPRAKLTILLYWGLCIACVLATIGTYERTGLVGLAVLGVFGFLKSRHKLVFGAMCLAVVLAVSYLAAESWTARMSTIKSYNAESSAATRILVWKWTYNYALSHPFGGGFDSYMINRLEAPSGDGTGEPAVYFSKAFHSVYFEVLGEHGWPGLAIFLLLSAASLLEFRRVGREARSLGIRWCADLANSLQLALTILLSCGAFIGIAFQPFLYYLFALAVCLKEYLHRASDATRDAPASGPTRSSNLRRTKITSSPVGLS